MKGSNFFELHAKFEEYYNDAIEKVDEIAERVLTLEGTPLHSYSAYMKQAEIKEDNGGFRRESLREGDCGEFGDIDS